MLKEVSFCKNLGDGRAWYMSRKEKNEINKTSYMKTEQGWNAIEGKRYLSHWEIFPFLII